ncbi:MAG: hypothetical protein JXR53_12565 [Bacteroidales bacterium]|nr:hypothetical protein [Bacteroidales bacterium]
MRKLSFLSLSLLIILSACNPVKTIYIEQELPPLRSFPENVKKIGFLNRITHDKTPAVQLDSDFLYFGESRDGSNASIHAVYNLIEKNDAYECVMFQTDLPLVGIEEMPEPLASEDVQQICSTLGLDIIISIEYFKADFNKEIDETTREGYDQMTESSTTMFVATMHSHIEAAFRVYIPGQEELFDEYTMGESLTYVAEGNTKKMARENLTKKRDAVVSWGSSFGRNYASRFAPRSFKTMRMICKGKDKRFKEAFKYAKNAEWEQAELLWRSLEKSDDLMVKSYALFNLALLAEVNGDLLKAASILKEAEQCYSFKELLRYQRIIETKMDVQAD